MACSWRFQLNVQSEQPRAARCICWSRLCQPKQAGALRLSAGLPAVARLKPCDYRHRWFCSSDALQGFPLFFASEETFSTNCSRCLGTVRTCRIQKADIPRADRVVVKRFQVWFKSGFKPLFKPPFKPNSQSSPTARDFDLSLRVPVLLLRTRVRVTAPIAGAPVRRAGSLEPKWLHVAPS